MVVERKIRSTAVHQRITDGIFQPHPQHNTQERAVAVVAEGAKEPVGLEDDEDEEEEEEAEVAFAVLLGQGTEVAAEASRASSSISAGLTFGCLNEQV